MSGCAPCSTEITVNFCPITLGADCIWAGYTQVLEVEFIEPADISLDTFTAVIKDSDGIVVDTMTNGSGITIGGTTILQITIGPPATTNPGKYTMKVIWTQAATGAIRPFSFGIVKVIPEP